MEEKKPLLIISGPTAVGKTELSLNLCKEIDGEVINADSMQVYKGMDIGTAKISFEERMGIPHHLIDICEPTESFDVVRFQSEAKKCIEEVLKRGHIPVLVGGTGFYIQAVLYDIDFSSEEPDEEYRRELMDYAKTHGEIALHERLKEIDEASANAIHPNNIKRVIRALEFYEKTHTPISEHNDEQRAKSSPYDFLYAVLTCDRQTLYERIDLRVDQMLDAGLVNEVKGLLYDGVTKEMTSMQGLGYKEIAGYLTGEYDLAEAVRILKRDTRHFAKRQLTWYKREKEVTYYDKFEFDSDVELTEKILTDFKSKVYGREKTNV